MASLALYSKKIRDSAKNKIATSPKRESQTAAFCRSNVTGSFTFYNDGFLQQVALTAGESAHYRG